MSKGTEAMFRELSKFMEQNTFENEEDAVRSFMEQWNAHPGAAGNQEPDAYDYLERAQDAATTATAVKYAKKALELDPTLIEAELIIAQRQSKTLAQLQYAIEGLLKKEEDNLAKQGITEAECAGEYYGMIETRPYIRLWFEYIQTLTDQCKMRKAAEACRKVLTLNEDDNTGVRYTLMAIYAALEEREPAEALEQTYQEDSAFMLLPMIALYYRLDDEEKGSACLARLCKENKHMKQAIRLMKKGDADTLGEIITAPYYEPSSKEEAMMAYAHGLFLYLALGNDFLVWMEQHLPEKPSSGTRGRKKK